MRGACAMGSRPSRRLLDRAARDARGRRAAACGDARRAARHLCLVRIEASDARAAVAAARVARAADGVRAGREVSVLVGRASARVAAGAVLELAGEATAGAIQVVI